MIMSKAYFDKRLERVKQRLGILFVRPDFHGDVLVFRKKWNIPEDGIETEDGNSEWRRWLTQETNTYTEKYLTDYKVKAQALTDQGKLNERDDLHKEFNAKVPLNAFRLGVLGFLKKYQIPFQWEEVVRRYLLFNKDIEPHIPLNSVTLQEDWNFDIGSWELSLKLGADTTLEDVKAIWSLVKTQQKKLHDYTNKKFQPIPNLEVDQRAYELKQQKLSHKDIADKITEEFNLDSYTYKEVSESLRHHKMRLGLL